MLERKSWKDFNNTGLVWIINNILRKAGWNIVVESNKEGEILDIYPAKIRKDD